MLLTKSDLIEMAYRPISSKLTPRISQKIIEKFLLMDEQNFLEVIQENIPMQINPIIKNRYYLS